MVTIFELTALAVVMALVAVYLAGVVQQRLGARAEQRLRRQLVAREQLLAELRLQRATQDTLQKLFEAARQAGQGGE